MMISVQYFIFPESFLASAACCCLLVQSSRRAVAVGCWWKNALFVFICQRPIITFITVFTYLSVDI